MGNRLSAQFKHRLGYEPPKKETEALDEDAQQVLDQLRKEYQRLTDGVVKKLRDTKSIRAKFSEQGIIHNYAELTIVSQYMELEKQENSMFHQSQKIIMEHPLWNAFFADIRGCGPILAGPIIASIDITKAEYPSSLWKYCGFDVLTVDGVSEGRRKKITHMVNKQIIDKDGNIMKEYKGLPYNPWLKSRIWLLATSFIRTGNEEYRKVYDNRKYRLQNHPEWSKKTDGHRHHAAMREVCKTFLTNLYKAWRPLEGLPVAPSYAEAKLGLIHGSAQKYAA